MSKLLNIRCDNCGSEYRISSRGEMNCRFCGSKIYLSDSDFKNYLKTRDEMLLKDKFNNDACKTDGDVLGFYKDYTFKFGFIFKGNHTNFIYDFSAIYNMTNKDIYVGPKNIVYVFDDETDYSKYLANIKIDYPTADIKNMEKYLPKIIANGQLENDKYAIILDKDENVYPVEVFSVGLKPVTTAWIISRLESLGCLLEFNELDMKNLNIEDIFINPKTHELYLYGNWENIRNSKNARDFLACVRNIAKSIPISEKAPDMYTEFLDSEPAEDAFKDFKDWDKVINQGFGGHNFIKFDYL